MDRVTIHMAAIKGILRGSGFNTSDFVRTRDMSVDPEIARSLQT